MKKITFSFSKVNFSLLEKNPSKKSRFFLYFRSYERSELLVHYIFGNHWDSYRPPYLILTETLTILLLRIYRFVVFKYPFERYSYILPYFWYTWHLVIKGFWRCWLRIWIKFFVNGGSNIANQNLNRNYKFVWN